MIHKRSTALKFTKNDKYNNSVLELVNINVRIKFGPSISSQDIEQKQNFERNSDISQGPKLYYSCAKKGFLTIRIKKLFFGRSIQKRKYVHELLVIRLFKPAQEKVWLGELTVPQ